MLVWMLLALALVALLVGLRVAWMWRWGPLQPWHLLSPPEPRAYQIDSMRWRDWMRREERAMRFVSRHIAGTAASGRYAPGQAIAEWNRTHVLLPEGAPRGAVVLVHGLTDCPYSLRHFAEAARAAGHAAIAIRLPGHGTVPAGLARASRQQWIAATQLAMREAARIAGGGPVALIGYSNGAALALVHAMRSLFRPRLVQPSRLILISPMIGVSRHARFAGLAAWPAIIPAFEHAAWLELKPEDNPCKYGSFAVNAAVQSQRLTMDVQRLIDRAARAGLLGGLPPILAFQSAVDATVSARAVAQSLFARLPAEADAELVLFDVNRQRLPRSRALEGLSAATHMVVTNPLDAQALAISPGEETPLGLAWPGNFLSLSHVALPFPLDDPLYGVDPADGVERGERGVAPGVVRLTANPFFPWVLERSMKELP